MIICYTYQEINPLEERKKKTETMGFLISKRQHLILFATQLKKMLVSFGVAIVSTFLESKAGSFQVADLFFS